MEYKTVVFIDANVALQCLDLRQLPWFEIDSVGPVLVLVTPTVLREVDSKKNDGRLGDHARRFNGFLRPLLRGAETVTSRPSPVPRVDVALARCSQIKWDSFPELDPSESDARIIAEALHTEVPASARKVFVSQDIRPLDLAKRHDLQIHHVEENWLRPKEMTEAERKAAALSRELATLKSKQPELIFDWSPIRSPVGIVRVKDLSGAEREAMLEQIRKANPMPKQERILGYVDLHLNNYDHTLKGRYEKWSERLLPAFVRQYEAKMELQYNQIEISLVLKNVGKVQAESLLLEIFATGGWMNSKLILIPPSGPSAPRPRPAWRSITRLADIPKSLPSRGRYEVVVEEVPKRSDYLQITCDDFRHGSEYEYKFVGWLDPRSEAPFELRAVATAANLHGEATSCVVLQKRIEPVEVFDLIDPDTLEYRKQSLVQARLLNTNEADYWAFEFEKYDDDE